MRRHELESLKKMYAVSGWDKMLNIFNSTVIAGDSMVDYGFLTANVLDFSEMLKTGIPFECVDLENPDEPLEKVHQALFFSGVGK